MKGGVIFLAILLFPILEITVAIGVVREYGFANAFFAWLVSLILGFGLFRTSTLRLTVGVAKAMREGKPPGLAAIDGAMIGLAGVLFLLPGYISDVFASSLLVPFVRHTVAARLHRAFGGGTVFSAGGFEGRTATGQSAGPTAGNYDAEDAAHAILDVDAVVVDDKNFPPKN